MDGKLLYLDPSAIVRLVVESPETGALRDELSRWPERVTSRLSVVEVMRSVRSLPGATEDAARRVLGGLALVNVDGEVLGIASELDPTAAGTADLVHIATALSLGDDFGALVSYDGRMLLAADASGLDVLVPGMSPGARPAGG